MRLFEFDTLERLAHHRGKGKLKENEEKKVTSTNLYLLILYLKQNVFSPLPDQIIMMS